MQPAANTSQTTVLHSTKRNKCSKLEHIAKACKSRANTDAKNKKIIYVDEQNHHSRSPDNYNPSEYITLKKIRRPISKLEEMPATTYSRYSRLQEEEQSWPNIKEGDEYRYRKGARTYRRKGKTKHQTTGHWYLTPQRPGMVQCKLNGCAQYLELDTGSFTVHKLVK